MLPPTASTQLKPPARPRRTRRASLRRPRVSHFLSAMFFLPWCAGRASTEGPVCCGTQANAALEATRATPCPCRVEHQRTTGGGYTPAGRPLRSAWASGCRSPLGFLVANCLGQALYHDAERMPRVRLHHGCGAPACTLGCSSCSATSGKTRSSHCASDADRAADPLYAEASNTKRCRHIPCLAYVALPDAGTTRKAHRLSVNRGRHTTQRTFGATAGRTHIEDALRTCNTAPLPRRTLAHRTGGQPRNKPFAAVR